MLYDAEPVFGVRLISSQPVLTSVTPAFVRKSNSRPGILFMLAGMFLFAAGDVCAKLLTSSLHPVQIVWFRQLGLLCGALVILGVHGTGILKTERHALQIVRGLLAICSSLLFIVAIKYVPLADAVAASFVAPFFLTILGAAVLAEKVSLRRWSAVLIGFLGALIVVRPGSNAIHPAVMLVVVAAACYATRQVIGRLLADTDRTLTTIAYTALAASLFSTLALPFFWTTPETWMQWLVLLSMAIFAGLGEVMVIKALELAEAAVVAPIHYTLILWGTVYGYLVFNQLPDYWTWIGTLIIVTAGIYTLKATAD